MLRAYRAIFMGVRHALWRRDRGVGVIGALELARLALE
jgi:hypothetical protein